MDKLYKVFFPFVGLVFLFAALVLSTDLSTAEEVETNLQSLSLTNSDGELISYNVEIADDEEEQQRGLMYRHDMALDHGMLFIFDYAEPQAFWMKNTYLPLDMIFADDHGKILCIHENTRPLDSSLYQCDDDVLYVLELNGGEVHKHGVRVGDSLMGSFLHE